jgi:hypothetical protein
LDEFFLVYHKLYPDCLKKDRSVSFNVDDVTIDPFYEKPEKKSRSGSASAAAGSESGGPAGAQKPGHISQIFRIIIIAIGSVIGLGILLALLR